MSYLGSMLRAMFGFRCVLFVSYLCCSLGLCWGVLCVLVFEFPLVYSVLLVGFESGTAWVLFGFIRGLLGL